MTADPHPHEVLLQEIKEEFAEILSQTSQGVYIYQDDPHWICNDRFATMMGYASAAEVAGASEESLLDAIVAPESQQQVVDAYMNAVENKVASTIHVVWKKKDGGSVHTQVIFVPISYKGNLLAIHFVTPI
jgi:PAS domain S-box-containing protein